MLKDINTFIPTSTEPGLVASDVTALLKD